MVFYIFFLIIYSIDSTRFQHVLAHFTKDVIIPSVSLPVRAHRGACSIPMGVRRVSKRGKRSGSWGMGQMESSLRKKERERERERGRGRGRLEFGAGGDLRRVGPNLKRFEVSSIDPLVDSTG